MRAVTIVDGALEWREHPDPVPGTRELLVAVRAAGVNSADLAQRHGFYPAPAGSPPDIPGLEFVAAPSFPANFDALATSGRISVIGVGGGGEITLPLFTLMQKRAVLRGS